ncbi:SCO family protein [Sneathiella glossodoripedis]|uniref:SCO family protein n=1 Tax=Sneathiella glossodoripedis TaxID=418853 RepID=UPI0004710B71|nr:SCO family protein [Sneathiella glossodoripedis]
MNRFFTYAVSVLVVVGLVIAAFIIANEMFGERIQGTSRTIVGAPQIGGPFTLVNEDGQQVTEEDFKGKLMLVFFGYTFCPDVCPTELNVFSEVMEALGEDAENVVPVFITVDPDRDTAEVIKEYTDAFHPSIIGLTGTPEQITHVKKQYRAYGQAVEKEKDPEFYLVDHTSFTYLMGRDGEMITVFSYGTKAEEIVANIEKLL